MTTIIGIDPGLSGGIAVIAPPGMKPRTIQGFIAKEVLIVAVKMPETEKDIFDFLSNTKETCGEVFAILENVHAMPKQGVASTWKFGQNYGALRMALIALGIPFETVAPGVWQRRMGCLSKGDKNITKRKAQELFPGLKITHAIADALLIAEDKRRRTKE